MRVAKPALVAYCFAPAELPDDRIRAVDDYLRGLWRACDSLGMTAPIDGAPADAHFPGWPTATGDPAPQLLAAKGRPSGDDTRQALLFVRHDTVALLACLAPNRDHDTLDTWTLLLDEWRTATERAQLPDDMLGAAELLLAVWPAGRPDWRDLEAAGWEWARRLLTSDDIALWESPPAGARRRLFGSIAPAEREDELNAWTWYLGSGDLPPFARYLLHAAKVHHQHRVFQRDIRTLRLARDQLDHDLALASGAEATREELLDAQDRLRKHETRWFDLLRGITKMRELQTTLTIAERNIEALAPKLSRDGPPEADSPFGADLELAAMTRRQIDHELVYAQGVNERAVNATNLSRLRLEEAAEKYTRRQNELTLLQSTLVAGPLAALAAIQGLAAVQVDKPLRAPLVALVFALASALPPLVVHASEPHEGWDAAAAGLLAATVAWMLEATLARQSDTWWDIAAAVLGGVLGVIALRVRQVRLRRSSAARPSRPGDPRG